MLSSIFFSDIPDRMVMKFTQENFVVEGNYSPSPAPSTGLHDDLIFAMHIVFPLAFCYDFLLDCVFPYGK